MHIYQAKIIEDMKILENMHEYLLLVATIDI